MARALGINHVALEVDNVDEALAWYGRFLTFELRGRRPTMAWIDLGDQFLALSAGRRQAPDDERHFGLVVDDKEAARAALRAAGVLVPDSGGASSGIELPPGFYFMFMFDYFSTPRRKNPAGVIEAFKRAFTPGEGPQLLIKTIHGAARPRASEELRHAAAGRTDVHVIDCALSSAAKNALLMECDCYVSLHRSEGYGLTLAECMALGKPVIGTGYSGNLDFMSPANSYLVDYEMTTVGHGVEIYPPEGRWAEPDLDHAAALMRGIHADPDAARARGLRAQRDIAASLSPEAVGRIARARLERLLVFGAADGGPGAEPCPG